MPCKVDWRLLWVVDWTVLKAINGFFYHHDAIEDPVLAYVNAAEVLFAGMLVVVLTSAYGPRRASWRRTAVAAGLSAGLALAVGKVTSEAANRARPFVTHPLSVHVFAHHAANASFPSDHATASFAIAVAILLRKRVWGVVALVAAVMLCIGRVALGLHYPGDVLGGAALGTVAMLVLWIDPIRARVNALADLVGRLWDGVLDWSAGRLGLAWRP